LESGGELTLLAKTFSVANTKQTSLSMKHCWWTWKQHNF